MLVGLLSFMLLVNGGVVVGGGGVGEEAPKLVFSLEGMRDPFSELDLIKAGGLKLVTVEERGRERGEGGGEGALREE